MHFFLKALPPRPKRLSFSKGKKETLPEAGEGYLGFQAGWLGHRSAVVPFSVGLGDPREFLGTSDAVSLMSSSLLGLDFLREVLQHTDLPHHFQLAGSPHGFLFPENLDARLGIGRDWHLPQNESGRNSRTKQLKQQNQRFHGTAYEEDFNLFKLTWNSLELLLCVFSSMKSWKQS